MVNMENVSTLAHYDGKQILLDEPVELEPNTKLIITVLPHHDSERESWLRLSADRLKDAFSDDEAEYPSALIKEPNPEYERK
jgi:hypothetical protein